MTRVITRCLTMWWRLQTIVILSHVSGFKSAGSFGTWHIGDRKLGSRSYPLNAREPRVSNCPSLDRARFLSLGSLMSARCLRYLPLGCILRVRYQYACLRYVRRFRRSHPSCVYRVRHQRARRPVQLRPESARAAPSAITPL